MGSYNARLINEFKPSLQPIKTTNIWVVPPEQTKTITLPIAIVNTIPRIAKSLNCSLDEAINTCAWHGNDIKIFPKINEDEEKIKIGIDKTKNIDNKIIEIALQLGLIIGSRTRKQVTLSEKDNMMINRQNGTRCQNYLKIVGNTIVEMI